MQSLNFLLGKYKCILTSSLGAGSVTLYETTTSILGGNYYQMSVEIPGKLNGYQTYGWNPVNHDYIGQYFDDGSTTGVATSPGWQDSKLNFAGQYVFVEASGGSSGMGTGADVPETDSWVIAGPGHHLDNVTYDLGGATGTASYDCTIIR